LRRKPRFSKLKPGPGRSPEEVSAHQLARLHLAMTELVATVGYRTITISELVRLAGVSKPTFYKFFADKEACFKATHDLVIRRGAKNVLASLSVADRWEGRVQVAARDFLEGVGRAPAPARLALLTGFEIGPRWVDSEARTIDLFATVLSSAHAGVSGRGQLPPVIARAVASGVAEVSRSYLLREEERRLDEVVDPIAEWAIGLSRRGDSQGRKVSISRRLSVEGDQLRSLRPDATSGSEGPRDQRDLLFSAATKLAVTNGYWSLDVARVCAAAGVSRPTFFAEFADVSDCFLAAVRSRAERVHDLMRTAYGAGESLEERVYLALCVMCLASNEPAGRLEFVDLVAPGKSGVLLRSELINDVGNILAGDEVLPMPELVKARASAGAIWNAIGANLIPERRLDLEKLVERLASIYFAPFSTKGPRNWAGSQSPPQARPLSPA
jgi:AcrR family transcriptional regulator